MSVLVAPPSSPLLTAEEFARLYHDKRAELVKGIVQEIPRPNPRHGKLCATISALIWHYAQERDAGHVMSNDSFTQTQRNPDTVRGPDVSYYSYARLPKGDVPDGLLPVQPDLVVEVRSPTNTWSDIFTKVGEYLKVGIRAVMVLDAASETASVYRPEEFQQIFHNSDVVVVPDVLPGFAVPLTRLFQ